MQTSAAMGDPGILPWLLVASSAGAMDLTTWIWPMLEMDDDGLMSGFISLTKGVLQPWINACSNYFRSWMKDVYDGYHQEYNDTLIPISPT